ncbi:MAG: FBP domain-containing protein [Mycetocola sp.]
MLPLTENDIRSSFINASRKEVSDLSLPLDFESIDWDRRDFFGWRDRKLPRRAYVSLRRPDAIVSILLQQAEALPRTRVLCSWCQDITLDDDVVFYGVKRAGAAGRKGNTIGTLVCADFGCSRNARKLPAVAYLGFDVHAAREKQIAGLQERVRRFIDDVSTGADTDLS